MSESITRERQLEDALQVRLLAPSLSSADALFAVGMPLEDARSSEDELADRMRAHCEDIGFHFISSSEDRQVDRVVKAILLMKRDPFNKSATALKGIGKMSAMKAVGMPAVALNGKSSQYAKVTRRLKKVLAEETSRAANKPATVPPAIHTGGGNNDGFVAPLLSPLTDSSTSSTSTDSPTSLVSNSSTWSDDVVDDFLDKNFFWPPTYPVDKTEDATLFSGKLTPYSVVASTPRMQSFQSLTTTANHRNSTQAAHAHRQSVAELKCIRSSLWKCATLLYQSVMQGENTLKAFSTPEKVANLFNNASRMELFSGNEIASAVDRGDAGKSPPRRGRPSVIPRDVFKAFAL